MSIQAVNWVLEHSTSTGNERCVLISIANHASRQGDEAKPSISTIAHESRCSARTVQRAIQTLKDSGELDWQPYAGMGKRRKTNLYWMPTFREQLDLPPTPDLEMNDDNLSPSPAPQMTTKRTADDDKTGPQMTTPVAHEPKENHPREPSVPTERPQPDFVAYFVEQCQERGVTALVTKSAKGALGKHCREMSAAGVSEELIRRGIDAAIDRGQPELVRRKVADLQAESSGVIEKVCERWASRLDWRVIDEQVGRLRDKGVLSPSTLEADLQRVARRVGV